MRKTIAFLAIMALLVLSAGLAQAATDAEKLAAIDKGLAWLAANQQANGSWSYGGGYADDAATGAALLAFTDSYYKSGWKTGTDYTGVVTKATSYLLNTAFIQNLSPANESGFGGGAATGILWGNGEATYVTGIVASGFGRLVNNPYGTPRPLLVNPNTVIGSGAATGLTYAQMLQKTADSYIWGQTPSTAGVYQGGWRYVPNITNTSDNSTSQWAPITFIFGQPVGVTVPQQTKNLLKEWVAYIQNNDTVNTPTLVGGAGYDSPYSYVNVAKTGGLLIEMDWIGGYGPPIVNGNKPLDKAITYLNNQWQTFANSTWDGNFGHPYAMWGVYKGLESTIGLQDPAQNINNFLYPGQPNWSWWQDYCQWLVDNQIPVGTDEGYWGGYSAWYGPLATAWDINILNGTRVGPEPGCPPGAPSCVPLPGTVVLLSSGLLGLVVLRKRMKP